ALPPPVRLAILVYAEAAGLARKPEQAVFPGRWRDQPVDGKYIGEQLRQAAELAGIPLERPLHTLRHSYARPLRRVEAPLEAVPNLAEELRRRRTALGWTLEQVAEQAQVSVGMLSLIETGKRRPSLKSWGRIRQTLGISEPLPQEAWRQRPREISDELVATLGACLAAVRSPTLAELAQATGTPISNVRLALRRLAAQ